MSAPYLALFLTALGSDQAEDGLVSLFFFASIVIAFLVLIWRAIRGGK